MWKWRCVLALLLSALVSPLHAQTQATVERFTLANGFETIVVPNHRAPVVTHMLWIRVGAADDPLGKSGLAHFHEHMMYQGTPNYPAGAYADLINEAGGEQNAFTGADATAYYVTIAKDKLPLAMNLEADRLRGLSPAADAAKKEKEVIIEERRMRIENNPAALFFEQMRASLWRNHPYRIPIIGWMHEMEKLSKSDVLSFHQRWYHPNNAVLILSGDITAKEARPLVERYYGGLPRGGLPGRRWNQEPPQNAARQLVMRHANVQQPLWSRFYASETLGTANKKHALPLLMLAQLLGGGKTSALYHALVIDKKIASDVDVDYDLFHLGPGEFEITVTPEPDTSMETITKAIDEELARFAAEGFDDKQLARAKSLLKAESVYARDKLSSMARIMGWIRILGLEEEYFLHWPNLIDNLTRAQVMEAAKITLVPSQSVTGWLLPEEGKKDK